MSFFDSRPEVFEVEQASMAAADHAAATRDVYLIFLEHFRPNVAAAIRAVANAPEGGVVVHCHGGGPHGTRERVPPAPRRRSDRGDRDRLLAQRGATRTRHEEWFAQAADEAELERLHRISKTPASSMVRCSRSSSDDTAASRLPEGRRSDGRGARAGPVPPVTEPRVLAVFGPTASGKSGVAEAIADRIPATLISADAMQVYRGLPILTNQSARETELVAIWDLDHEASVGEYAELAHAAVDGALARETTPVVVGGTGLYLAALGDLDLPPAPEPGARERGGRVRPARRGGRARAPRGAGSAAAARVHANDRRRVVRALELSEAGASLAPSEGRLWSEDMRYPTLVVGLEVPKDVLDGRIATRTKQMFESGVEEEVRRALERPISSTARTVHGLSDIAELRDEAIAALIRRTRRYAAYQRNGCDAYPALLRCLPIARLARWPMRFSKWHGLGNDYLLVQRAEVGTPRAAALRLPLRRRLRRSAGSRLGRRRRSRSSDLEPGRLDGRTVGERTRIAARWPARRSVAADTAGFAWARAKWSGGCEARLTSKWTWVP